MYPIDGSPAKNSLLQQTEAIFGNGEGDPQTQGWDDGLQEEGELQNILSIHVPLEEGTTGSESLPSAEGHQLDTTHQFLAVISS